MRQANAAVAAWTIVLTCLAVVNAEAQRTGAISSAGDSRDASWVHESWTVKDGLPVNSINALLQDRTGYLWAATFDGLVRFDGLRFTVFNSANSEDLPSNRIIELKEGRDGSLWLTTEQGHIVRFRSGRFSNVAFEGGKASQGTLSVDSAGTVWVGTSEGLWKVRRDALVRVGRGTLDARVTAMLQRRDGSLWVGTDGAGIYRVTGDGRVTRVVTDPALEPDVIWRMVEDESGALWIAGMRALWSWHERLIRVKGGPQPPNFVETVVQLPATGAVFGAAASGVYRIDSGTAVLVRPRSSDGLRLWAGEGAVWNVEDQDVLRDGRRVFTLPERRIISAALFDREGSLWLGTDAGGLHRLKAALFTTYSLPEGVGHPNVYATYVDRSGAIWLGTWGRVRAASTPSRVA